MLNRTPNEYDRLLPYLEGALDDTERTQMEARLAADSALAAEADRLRRTVSGLRGTASRLGPAENSEVPATLWPRLRARLEETPLPAPKPRGQSWWLAGVGATAAAGLAVAAFWLPGWRAPEMRVNSPVSAPVNTVTPPNIRRNVPGASAHSVPVTPAVPHAAPIVAYGPPAALPANKPAAPPTRVAAVPVRVPKPEYTITDPFALPSPPAYYAPAPHSAGATVEERRFKATGDVRFANSAGMERREKSTPRDFTPPVFQQTAPVTQPPPPAPAPIMNAAPVVIAQGQNQPALTLNNVNATNGLDGFAGGQIAAPGLASHGQPQQTADAQSKGNVQAPQRPPSAQLFAQRNSKVARRGAPMTLGGNVAQAYDGNGADNLDTWQNSLASAVQSPQWGDNARMQSANQALMSAKISGLLDDLRARLEARRAQSPQDLVNARMLAAVYEYGFSADAALRERRRITELDGAVGEDWFALAQAEEKHGNVAAARTAYRRALESPTPPTPFHAGIARGRS